MKIRLPRSFTLFGVLYVLLNGSFSAAEAFDQFRDCASCPEMIELPLGSFLMGAPDDEFRRNVTFKNGIPEATTPDDPYIKEDEGPRQSVVVDYRFAISKNEITRSQWMSCVNAGGCRGYVPPLVISRIRSQGGKAWVGDNHPVLKMSYNDAASYVAWLNESLGTNTYRLPTEAEWEYAARSGTTTRFAQGDSLTTEQAVFSGERTEKMLLARQPHLITRGAPVRVNELSAENDWGIRHMSGNAMEITSSCYSARYEVLPTLSDWLGKTPAEGCQPVIRGGAFGFPMDMARVAWRGKKASVDRRVAWLGFRIVKRISN